MTLDAAGAGVRDGVSSAAEEGRPGALGGPAGVPDANELVAAFRVARESDELVVLEGFHPLKHALRFGAQVDLVVTYDIEALLRLARDHAPELEQQLAASASVLTRKDFRRLGPYEPHTGVVSIARRARYDASSILGAPGERPIVLLDEPRHRGNFGAVIRVAAAAGAAGVLSTGAQDPWHPVVVRGAAGLQFAVPVARLLCPLSRTSTGARCSCSIRPGSPSTRRTCLHARSSRSAPSGPALARA